eukprot:2306854-Rhodomonas_salina.3
MHSTVAIHFLNHLAGMIFVVLCLPGYAKESYDVAAAAALAVPVAPAGGVTTGKPLLTLKLLAAAYNFLGTRVPGDQLGTSGDTSSSSSSSTRVPGYPLTGTRATVHTWPGLAAEARANLTDQTVLDRVTVTMDRNCTTVSESLHCPRHPANSS